MKEKLKQVLSKLLMYLTLVGIVFSFLTICNWGYNPMDWNGFSRVFLGIFIVVPIIISLDDWK